MASDAVFQTLIACADIVFEMFLSFVKDDSTKLLPAAFDALMSLIIMDHSEHLST